jgi:hypothetical protein
VEALSEAVLYDVTSDVLKRCAAESYTFALTRARDPENFANLVHKVLDIAALLS